MYQALDQYFSQYHKIDIGNRIPGRGRDWCEDRLGPDRCVFVQDFQMELDPEARWTYIGSKFYFREIEDLILFKLAML